MSNIKEIVWVDVNLQLPPMIGEKDYIIAITEPGMGKKSIPIKSVEIAQFHKHYGMLGFYQCDADGDWIMVDCVTHWANLPEYPDDTKEQ